MCMESNPNNYVKEEKSKATNVAHNVNKAWLCELGKMFIKQRKCFNKIKLKNRN